MKGMIKVGMLYMVGLCIISFNGCISMTGQQNTNLAVPNGIPEGPSIRPEYADLPSSEGSLFTGQSRFFFEDTKASIVGDTVIVDIVENSYSSMQVSTETKRNSGIDLGVKNLFGKMPTIADKYGITDTSKLLGTSYESELQGEAESDRSGQVTASIAARVTEVLPNGNLSLYGKRAIKANNEVQYIIVSGIVRPQDISSNNRVQSVSLADSRIEYFGEGALADKQRPGWGVRLFDNIWPF